MTKKIILMSLIVLTFISCNKKVVDAQSKTEVVTDSHSSKTAVDIIGVYSGVLPCADCEGIETILTIKDETNYLLTTKYLNKQTQAIERKGTYTWNDKGNTITLSGNKDMPNQFFVGENQVTQLDLKGNKITGNLANNYILKKNMTFENSQMNTNILQGKKFKLIEMGGVPLAQEEKIYYIQFDGKGGFSAYVGCNNISGQYEISNTNSIKFSKAISTRMACPNMQIEQRYMKFLEEAAIYSQDENIISLSKANSAPFIRFELIN